MSSNPLLQHPHVYKKGKILNLKKLDEGTNKPKRVYNFASSSGNITTIQNHCNNLNQIVGRNFLGIAKLLSYFGLSKDPSEKFSKEPTVYNKFRDLFSDRGRDKDLQPLLEKTYDKLSNLDNKIEKQDIDLKKLINREPVSRKEIEDFSKEIKKIKEKLVTILGA